MARYFWGGVVIILIFFSSCTSQKQLIYLQDIDTLKAPEVSKQRTPDYKIQNSDILYIRIMSIDPEINQVYNPNMSQNQQNIFNNDQSFYIYGYSVNDSGYVTVPFVGAVKVAGLTVEEAKNAIQRKTNDVLKNATVDVKLVSFKYSVLGEVKKPGTYTNFNNQLTVLEAISRAGDITDYGNRKRVLVLRPGETKSTVYRVDLTNSRFLTSDAFFLLPNDIVYVEPIKSKPFRINIPIFSLLLTSVSTLILVLSFIK